MVDRDGITELSRGTPELSSVSARSRNSDFLPHPVAPSPSPSALQEARA